MAKPEGDACFLRDLRRTGACEELVEKISWEYGGERVYIGKINALRTKESEPEGDTSFLREIRRMGASEDLIEKISFRHGGMRVYIGKQTVIKTRERDIKIQAMLESGMSVLNVANKVGLQVGHVYVIEFRLARQKTLVNTDKSML